ncbi:MAG: diacylglycerol kinase [Flavobacteriales bacterium TMED123]|nr:MAG: diacylglycerol kinase [Flavobacteriales bacterium TMED123]|tara:strand:+ start:2058 stop:2564 length:507 start_codon:yes stop_codon:yes gene_type:complete
MKVSLIVAASENGVIGKDNDLIWHLPKDMRFFKDTTMGHHVIMGRKNFESIPHKFRPLPNRTNVVITRQTAYKADGCMVVSSIEEALQIAKHNGEDEAFIIGGGQIYKLALEANLVDKIYLTKVHQSFEGDTFFPGLNKDWKEISRIQNQADEKHLYNFDFITLEKNQ